MSPMLAKVEPPRAIDRLRAKRAAKKRQEEFEKQRAEAIKKFSTALDTGLNSVTQASTVTTPMIAPSVCMPLRAFYNGTLVDTPVGQDSITVGGTLINNVDTGALAQMNAGFRDGLIQALQINQTTGAQNVMTWEIGQTAATQTTITVPFASAATATPRIWTVTGQTIYVNGGVGITLHDGGQNWVYHPEADISVGRELNHRGGVVRSIHRERQFDGADQAEILALQLLRKMVAPDEFRRYLRYGHVSVRGASGLVYQIVRRGGVRVWDGSEEIASLCVHLSLDNCKVAPPTDHVVGKMLIVECDEPSIWTRANVSWVTQNRRRRSLELVRQAA